MDPLISIVVIGRNEEGHIARCLESCLAADWDNKEIIYCDSESGDRSVEIARQYPVHIIVHENIRRNPSVGRNVGIRAASGDYVYLIDADMILEPDFLRRAYPVLVVQPEIACVIGIRREMRTDNSFVRLINSSYHAYASPGEVAAPGGGGGLFKRTALLAAGGYYERFRCSEEDILGQDLRRLGHKIVLIDATMAFHDLGVHTPAQYLRFVARQGKIFADTLLLDDHVMEKMHRLARKHVAEFLLAVAWSLVLGLLTRWHSIYVLGTALGLIGVLVRKYLAVRRHPMANLYFVHSIILSKPLHIVSEMYYLARGLLAPAPVEVRPDGRILAEWHPGNADE